MSRSHDTQFMGELRAAVVRKPRTTANLLLFSIIGFVIFALVWAGNAPLDEVTMGVGRVIPSSKLKTVQNLEGGLVSEIRVREGERVKAGQLLLIIDDTQAKSKFSEDKVKLAALETLIVRLRAEVGGLEPKYSDRLVQEAPDFIENELALYEARKSELQKSINVLHKQAEQKTHEIVELRSRISGLKESYKLGDQQVKLLAPVVKKGASSKMELIRLQREVLGLKNELVSSQQSLPRAKSALEEISLQIEERQANFRSEAFKELNEAIANARALKESMTVSEDRLSRTEVASPVDGTVKQILVNTIGGVVQPGEDLVEIVPDDESLLVEARVRPSEIAFLHPGQKAKVKVTAYDYAIYGSMDAVLVHISADTITDENGESFYEIKVRTDRSYLGKEEGIMPILPGMVAEVDILTGKKTVLAYLMKPILRAQQRALTER